MRRFSAWRRHRGARRPEPAPRMRGAVSAMRQARSRVTRGLLPEEVPAFRAEIERIVGEIESICQRTGQPIEAFPAPTRQAYHYLKDLSTSEIPLRGAEGADSAGATGLHHDLVASFDRVNTAYFDGAMDRPQLTWGARPTRRRLASYTGLSDTVRFSPSLDRADLPSWFIDFVMFHELLHKQLGVEQRGGRRHAHTSAFRRAERRFERYAEAQELLERLGSLLD